MGELPVFSRRRALGLLGGIGVAGATGLTGIGGPAAAGAAAEDRADLDPLVRLRRGNRRFAEGRARHPHQAARWREQVAAGQHPFAIVATCSDSRLSPELLFDQGIGDLFAVRIAGNVVTDEELGSIEYAVEEFDCSLVLVVGHERCGAVKATIDALASGSQPPGHIGALVNAIRPAVEAVAGQPGDLLVNAVRANTIQSMARVASSPLLAERLDHGSLRVVGAVYDLDDGVVSVLEGPA